MNQLLDQSLVLAQTGFSRNITVQKNYQEVPMIRVDAGQLQQVFLNILVNAGDAIGEEGTIQIATSLDTNDILVTIQDNGPGIRSEDIPHLFEPFFTTKDVGKGIGLGLHISYDIVKAHGGELSATSQEGKGAIFTVRLPLTEVSQPNSIEKLF